MQGIMRKALLVEHHEPIVLIGIPKTLITAILKDYEGLEVGKLVRGTQDHNVDIVTGASTEGWPAYAMMMVSSLVLGSVFIALGYLVSVLVKERATAIGAAIGLWLIFVVLYDLLLFGALTMDKDQLISQQLFSMLMLVSPTDTYRVLNLSSFEGVSEAAGIAGVASEAGLSVTLLVSVMLLWVIAPLVATLLVFQRREPWTESCRR